MTRAEKRTISLPSEQAGYIDAQVASGVPTRQRARSSEPACGRCKERDAAVARWLQTEVAPAYDAMLTDPARAIPAEAVLQNLRAHHAKRLTNPA
jgi:antitoxin ParD1/3/4